MIEYIKPASYFIFMKYLKSDKNIDIKVCFITHCCFDDSFCLIVAFAHEKNKGKKNYVS